MARMASDTPGNDASRESSPGSPSAGGLGYGAALARGVAATARSAPSAPRHGAISALRIGEAKDVEVRGRPRVEAHQGVHRQQALGARELPRSPLNGAEAADAVDEGR